MNSSRRWAYYFVSALECAKCREKRDLTLYKFDGKPVISEEYTIEQLRKMVPRMDVWCSDCGVTFNTRITGPGRMKHKEEAAYLADLRLSGARAGLYDWHTTDSGDWTKVALIDAAKNGPCSVCHVEYPPCVMDFHHPDPTEKIANVSAMRTPRYTLLDVVAEIEKCVLVCSNCHRLISNGLIEAPKEKIVLDENFFIANKKE